MTDIRSAITSPTVSLILPVHRDGEDLRRCLGGIAALDPGPVEFVVVVDGAEPGLTRLVGRHASRVLWVHPPGGPARARNLGARTAVGDVLLFVDADVAVEPDLVARVSRHLHMHPEVAAVIGSYDNDPAEPNFLSQYKNLLNHYVHQRARTDGYTFWGACGAIRRTVFLRLGGFDESYRTPSIEDIELGYRLRAAGERINVVKDIQVKHLKHWGTATLLRSDILARALPWSELILRTGRLDDDLNIDRSGRAKVALAGILAVSLAAGTRRRSTRATAVVAAATLLGLDAALVRFFARQRGWRFAAATVPWQWLSYLYSGGAFVVAVGRQVGGSAGRRISGAPPGRRP